MARPITQRRIVNFLGGKLLENGQAMLPPITFFKQPGGENRILPLTEYGTELSPFMENFILNTAGKLQTRNGTDTFGAVTGGDSVNAVVVYTSPSSVDYILRARTTGIDIWQGSLGWTALSGPVLTLSSITPSEFTVWNQTLLMTDGLANMYEIDVVGGVYALMSNVGVGKHITTFGSRVISSNIVKDAASSSATALPSRIEWCVKDDNTDWSGLGSGYEDLLSAPGGVVDTQHGVIPVTDTEAFVVRASSVWTMTTTGLLDTPFQFTPRFAQGTDSPYSILRIPAVQGQDGSGGIDAKIMFLGTDDVLLVRPEGIEGLGWPIRDALFDTDLDTGAAKAVFDPRLRRYRLYIPLVTPGSESLVWDYYVDRQKWMHVVYPFNVKSFFFKDVAFVSRTMDELPGTFDSLTGEMDGLSTQSARQPYMFMAVNNLDRVMYETDGLVGDTSALTGGGPLPISIELRTGEIGPIGDQYSTEFVKFQLLYEASQTTEASVEYSENGGTTWNDYGTLTLPITTQPTLAVCRKTLYRSSLQFRLIVEDNNDASGLKIHALYIATVAGSEVQQ